MAAVRVARRRVDSAGESAQRVVRPFMSRPVPPAAAPDFGPVVSAARDLWVKKLIDLSRRNTLLFFRDLKRGMLELAVDSEAVGGLLQGEEVKLKELARSEVRPREPQETAQALAVILRKAVSNREEKGIETLQLALGMASWPALDGGSRYCAPVLLVPVQSSVRGQLGQDLRLQVQGAAQLNPVLLHVLREDYRASVDAEALLAECNREDEDGEWSLDPQQLWSRLTEAVADGVPDFVVQPRAVIANFTFARMPMVEDLRANAAAMATSALLAAFAGDAESRERLRQQVPAGDGSGGGSDRRAAREEFHVLLSDSSQQAAIEAAERGAHLVIQGPPGTGKSQTIANLIAQCVANGKSVLFVAEKRAALDAVIKRLSDPRVGLGHLVLDLHGATISRREVMARLKDTLGWIRDPGERVREDATLERFDARRLALNEHARRVNEPRAPLGASFIQVVGRLLRLPAAARSEVRVGDAAFAGFGGDRLRQLRDRIGEIEGDPGLYLGATPTPWRDAAVTDGDGVRRALEGAREVASRLVPELAAALEGFSRDCGAAAPLSWSGVAELAGLLADVRDLGGSWHESIHGVALTPALTALEPAARGRFARVWASLTSAAYRAARRELQSHRRTPAETPNLLAEARRAVEVRVRWQRMLGDSAPRWVPAASAVIAAFGELDRARTELRRVVPAVPGDDASWRELGEVASALVADSATAFRMPAVRAMEADLRASGLEPFLRSLGSAPTGATLSERFEYVIHATQLEQIFAREPELARFQGRSHEKIVADFLLLDDERLQLAAARVRHLHASRAIEAMNQHPDESSVVLREASKKARHIPLRRLLEEAPHVLTRVAPCWLASPLSVSQLLAPQPDLFDVLIFDEASQIPPEDAVPAIYRARQIVAAGDQHQMPPTPFFATQTEEEDLARAEEDESRDGRDRARGAGSPSRDVGADEPDARTEAREATSGFESVLASLESFLPNRMLEWHYRSEDERLITFSNAEVYSKRLITFPSARDDTAIRHVLVPSDASLSGQEESASREVERVVELVLEHARQRSGESLGVIALSIKHANRLEAAIDRAAQDHPELEPFLDVEREERFFVKNLERVQGDERDAIILSLGYGKGASGDLPLRFGPLLQDAGYRRLNVAITRAKRRMTLVSSFSAHDIDLKRSGARGVAMLKAYLEYAANGGSRFVRTERADEIALNAFEADIRDALEGRGVALRSQFGALRFRIDLVAMHPERKGQPVLAIECDGATYHSSTTARDRDRIRQKQLERLGWVFHRVWSTDWFRNREAEIERALAAYRAAVKRADQAASGRAAGPGAASSSGSPAARAVSALESSAAGTAREAALDRSRPIEAQRTPARSARDRGPPPDVEKYESLEEYSDLDLHEVFSWITSDGLNRLDEEMLEEAKSVLQFKRMGSRIRAHLSASLARWKAPRSR